MLIVQAALAVLLGSPKIVCRLRTRRVECSKLGKTQHLMPDAAWLEIPDFTIRIVAAGCI